ncbi:MAG: hypothetical protein ACM4D3_24580 [Candidatus Sericytochromatia bacterium]
MFGPKTAPPVDAAPVWVRELHRLVQRLFASRVAGFVDKGK